LPWRILGAPPPHPLHDGPQRRALAPDAKVREERGEVAVFDVTCHDGHRVAAAVVALLRGEVVRALEHDRADPAVRAVLLSSAPFGRPRATRRPAVGVLRLHEIVEADD